MKYQLAEKAEKHNGGMEFPHTVILQLTPARKEELETFLHAFGERHNSWRVRYFGYSWHWNNTRDTKPRTATVRFVHKNDAMRFKLSWQECAPYPPSPLAWYEAFKKGMKPGEILIFGAYTGAGKTMFK